MFRSQVRVLFFAALVSPLMPLGAPYPATSSSLITDPHRGFAQLLNGYEFKLPSQWAPRGQAQRFQLQSSAMTMAIDTQEIPLEQSLEQYFKKWVKEYNGYGFDILGTRAFQQFADQPGLVVDLVSRAQGRQLRQVLVRKQGRLAIITCQNQIESFQKDLSSCNETIKLFRWL